MTNCFNWINNLFNPNKPKKNSLQEELFFNSRKATSHKAPDLTQQRVDEILDKINQQGYNSLNQEEKDLLKRAGEEFL